MPIANISHILTPQVPANPTLNQKKAVVGDHKFIDVLKQTEVGQVNGTDFANKEIEDLAKEFSGTMQAQLWVSVFEKAFPEGEDNIALYGFLRDALVKQQKTGEMDALAQDIYIELLRDKNNRNLLNEVVSKD